MMRKSLFILAFASIASASQATVLAFDITGIGNGQLMPQAYGDNVTAATMGNFSYGVANGFTPDVTVQYQGSANDDLHWWSTGYSDLTNVLEYEPDGNPFFTVKFNATSGNVVNLESFDLGNFGGAIVVPGIEVRNAAGAAIWSTGPINLPASNQAHLSFSPMVSGTELTLFVDISGLGGNSDNVGLDNISFTQSAVPEPSLMIASGLGLAAVLRRRRR